MTEVHPLAKCVSESVSHSVVSLSLLSHELQPARLPCPWNSPGRNTGVGSTPFSRGTSQPRDQMQVSCIAGEFFTIWATRETLKATNKSLSLNYIGN